MGGSHGGGGKSVANAGLKLQSEGRGSEFLRKERSSKTKPNRRKGEKEWFNCG